MTIMPLLKLHIFPNNHKTKPTLKSINRYMYTSRLFNENICNMPLYSVFLSVKNVPVCEGSVKVLSQKKYIHFIRDSNSCYGVLSFLFIQFLWLNKTVDYDNARVNGCWLYDCLSWFGWPYTMTELFHTTRTCLWFSQINKRCFLVMVLFSSSRS